VSSSVARAKHQSGGGRSAQTLGPVGTQHSLFAPTRVKGFVHRSWRSGRLTAQRDQAKKLGRPAPHLHGATWRACNAALVASLPFAGSVLGACGVCAQLGLAPRGLVRHTVREVEGQDAELLLRACFLCRGQQRFQASNGAQPFHRADSHRQAALRLLLILRFARPAGASRSCQTLGPEWNCAACCPTCCFSRTYWPRFLAAWAGQERAHS
jgi:hypothetical protein